jgi:iron complex outermembrane receptor protein
VDWRGLAEVEMGVQGENYREAVIPSGPSNSEATARPLRAYGNSALLLGPRLKVYAGYTQGLEDSGAAPSGATNRGAVLPVSQTWQVDSGLRYAATPHLNIIAGPYELQKPYFNLDASGVDRELGTQRAKGAELSIAGQHIDYLDINVGIVVSKVSIVGPDLAAEGVGPIALGQPTLQYVANVNYTVPWWPILSLDLAAQHSAAAPATVDDRIYSPAITEVSLGGRYKFMLLGKNSTLRLQIQNLLDSYWWTTGNTPGFFPNAGPRTVFAYLTTDL